MSDSTQIASESATVFPYFFCLPLELREIIYAFALEDTKDPRVNSFTITAMHPLTFGQNWFPGICFASRRTHDEALLSYLRLKTFAVNGDPGLLPKFLRTLFNRSALSAVRSVKVGTPSLENMTKLHDVLAQCPGIRCLVIPYPLYYLIYATWKLRWVHQDILDIAALDTEDCYQFTRLENSNYPSIEEKLLDLGIHKFPSLKRLEIDLVHPWSLIPSSWSDLIGSRVNYFDSKKYFAGVRIDIPAYEKYLKTKMEETGVRLRVGILNPSF
jgi:hypothetical protein